MIGQPVGSRNPAGRSPPPDMLALGKLMSFYHGANALKVECKGRISDDRLDAFEDWLSRNRLLVDKLNAYGRNVNWFGADVSRQEFWDRMQTQEAERIQYRITEVLKQDAAACNQLSTAYAAGEFELFRFQEDLTVLGIRSN